MSERPVSQMNCDAAGIAGAQDIIARSDRKNASSFLCAFAGEKRFPAKAPRRKEEAKSFLDAE
jgi:hypothetical protein